MSDSPSRTVRKCASELCGSLREVGRCRCEQVEFTVTKPPLLTMACHCIGCQRMSASAFSLGAAIPKEGFEVTKGETVIGGLHGDAKHHFCPHCKSWLFSTLDVLPFISIRPTMLDDHDHPWCEPFIETYTDEKLSWAQTGASHSFANFPPDDQYGSLIAEFQTRVPRS